MRVGRGSHRGATTGRPGWLVCAVALALVVACGISTDAGSAPGPAPGPRAESGTVSGVLRIMPLGSSSTYGVGSPWTGGFRGPLEELLTRDGIAYDMVGSVRSGPAWLPDPDHEGHGGATMIQMQPKVAGWVTAQRPDIVLLQVGTNDLLTGTSATSTGARLDLMLDTIHASAPAARVVVAGVWAPLPRLLSARQEYARISAEVVARQRAEGRAVTFVDTSSLLGAYDLFDGLHPNAPGYIKIADMWEAEIRSVLTGRRG